MFARVRRHAEAIICVPYSPGCSTRAACLRSLWWSLPVTRVPRQHYQRRFVAQNWEARVRG
eukprot:364950-Chlamydomonas_euryale.AAC.8